jgi:uncharacterized membrane protein YdjX (TVP38/TMEM64 family)
MKSRYFQLNALLSFFIGFVFISVLCYLSLQLTSDVLAHSNDPSWLTSYIAKLSTREVLLILGAFVVLMTLGIPRQAISFFCGVGFGAIEGCFVALLLTCMSASAAYLMARGPLNKLLAPLIKTNGYASKLLPLRKKFVDNSFRTVLMVRLFPIGSNVATNVIAGACRVPFIPFITASTLGFVPQTVLFSLLGSGSRYISTVEQPINIAGLVISVFLILSLSRYTRKEKAQ